MITHRPIQRNAVRNYIALTDRLYPMYGIIASSIYSMATSTGNNNLDITHWFDIYCKNGKDEVPAASVCLTKRKAIVTLPEPGTSRLLAILKKEGFGILTVTESPIMVEKSPIGLLDNLQ